MFSFLNFDITFVIPTLVFLLWGIHYLFGPQTLRRNTDQDSDVESDS